MTLSTSYFARVKSVDDLCLISIARFAPKWFRGKEYKVLAPSVDLLNRYKAGVVSEEDYTREFNKYLASLDIRQVKNDLIEMTQGDNGVLLCYEYPSSFCHRHLVAKWLSDNLNMDIRELLFTHIRMDSTVLW